MKRQIKLSFVLSLSLLVLLYACGAPFVDSTPTPSFVFSATSTMQSSQTKQIPVNTPVIVSPSAQVVTQVTVFLVALEDNGKNGVPIGCGDSLVAVDHPVDPTTNPVQVALEELFSYRSQFIGESGLYTSLYQSDLKVQSIEYGPGGDIWVALTGVYQLGGECDNPRFQSQIEQTILTASGATAVNVTINDKPLHEIVSNR